MSTELEIEISSIPLAPDPVVEPPPEIERIPLADLSYEQFFARYLLPNKAVILSSVADSWECFRRWINHDSNGLNGAYLREAIPNLTVPVANCGKQYYNSHEKTEMKFHEFLDCWDCREESTSKLYLKDWHLREMLPEYEFYETPYCFASDWLNEYLLDHGEDDYMFVYLGREGTWTSFHADVFSSYSWSTNIFGVKKWLLLAPKEEQKLKDSLGNLPFRISEELLDEKEVKYYNILQKAGEAIFAPSGWYHQVQNVEDAISVNHNWFNGCNVKTIWLSLNEALEQVIKEIDDCKDMENFDEHCQLMLKASYGMDLNGFIKMLIYICKNRVSAYRDEAKILHFERYRLGKNHILFDLKAIRNVFISMIEMREELLGSLNLFDELKSYEILIDKLLT